MLVSLWTQWREETPPRGVSQHQGQVLCWGTWPARISSLGIRHPPGQIEDTEVCASWYLPLHRDVLTSWCKPGLTALLTEYQISFVLDG